MLRAALWRSGLRLLAERPVAVGGEPTAAVIGRRLCSKPEEGPSGPTFKVPAHKPSDFEKKILVWGGRFKNKSDVPEYVSYEMVDAAKSKVRVKVSVFLMLLTIMGCFGMVISGKAAARRHESLANINLEKRARLKAEASEAEK